MRCFDDTIELQSNDQQSIYKQFVIQFTYCNPKVYSNCQDFHDVRNFMSGISVLLLANSKIVKDINVEGTPWGDAPSDFQFVESSRVYWAHVDTQGRIEQHYKLKQGEAVSYELTADGTGKRIETKIAHLERAERTALEIYGAGSTRELETTFEVIIERDLDLKKIYAQHTY